MLDDFTNCQHILHEANPIISTKSVLKYALTASPKDSDNNPIILQSFGVELDLSEQTSFSTSARIKALKIYCIVYHQGYVPVLGSRISS